MLAATGSVHSQGRLAKTQQQAILVSRSQHHPRAFSVELSVSQSDREWKLDE